MNRLETMNKIMEETQTIGVVGLSRRQSRAGYYVPAYLQQHGYRIIPINPYLTEILEEKAYSSLLDVPETIDLVLIFRQNHKVPPAVEEAIQIGAKAIWMQLGIVNEPAAEKARAAGLDVVMDACLMVEHRRWHQKTETV